MFCIKFLTFRDSENGILILNKMLNENCLEYNRVDSDSLVNVIDYEYENVHQLLWNNYKCNPLVIVLV